MAVAALPIVDLPEQDNTSQALASLLAANQQYRNSPWPVPYDQTNHEVQVGDARDLSWLADESVHLVVTSPPYWTLKEYEDKVLGADERIVEREVEIFDALRGRVAAEAPRIQDTARGLAALDVLAALAETASVHNYTKPLVHAGDEAVPRPAAAPPAIPLGEAPQLVTEPH